MDNQYTSLCPVCDEDFHLSYDCPACQQTMCSQCGLSHSSVCPEAVREEDDTHGRRWLSSGKRYSQSTGRHTFASHFGGQGDDSQDNVKTRLDELSAFVEDMVIKYNAVEVKATALQDENKSLRQDLRSAHDNNAKLLLEMRDAQREQGALQRELLALQREMGQLRDSNVALSEDVTTLKAEMSKVTAQVAFHARLSTHVYPGGNNMNVICNDVLTSIGGGYDPQTGIFTVPVAGTYIILASAAVNQGGNAFYIDLDGTNIASPYTNPNYGGTSCHVTVKLNAGQNVSMKAYANYYFQGTSQQSWTSFSGMLVHPEL